MDEQRRQKLALTPITIREASLFVTRHHRHHRAPQGGLFAVAASAPEGETWAVVGVAIVGRPVARHADNGYTAEVTRVATTGAFSACSLLYGACWRAARALGYTKLITYTLAEEDGGSLRGAGWRIVGESKGGSWSCASRPRVDKHPLQAKIKWEAK